MKEKMKRTKNNMKKDRSQSRIKIREEGTREKKKEERKKTA